MSIRQKVCNLRADYLINNQKMSTENLKLVISIVDYRKLEEEEPFISFPEIFKNGKIYYQGLQLIRSSDLQEGEMGIIN